MRPETGPMRFALPEGDDWPGVFIRGDAAYGYASALEEALSARTAPSLVTMMQLRELQEILESCNMHEEAYDSDSTQLAVLTGAEEARRARRGEI